MGEITAKEVEATLIEMKSKKVARLTEVTRDLTKAAAKEGRSKSCLTS